MIKLSGVLICKNDSEADLVRRYLPKHKELTLEESGCLSFSVEATQDPLIWHVTELFTSQETFDAHQQRTKESLWGQKTMAIIREYEITEVV